MELIHLSGIRSSSLKKITKDKFSKYLIEKDFIIQDKNDSVIMFQKKLLVGAVNGLAIFGKGKYKDLANEDENKTKTFLTVGTSNVGLAIIGLQILILTWVLGLGLLTSIVSWIIFRQTAVPELDKIELMLQKEFI